MVLHRSEFSKGSNNNIFFLKRGASLKHALLFFKIFHIDKLNKETYNDGENVK